MLGVELLIIGMGTVVLSLYLLSVFLHFSGKFFGPKYPKRKIESEDNTKEDSKQKLAELKNNTDDVQKVNAKKIAAVSAAVFEMLKDGKSYRIISIKKSNYNWKR